MGLPAAAEHGRGVYVVAYPVKRGVRVQNAFGGTPRQGSGIVRRPRGRGGITTRVVRG